MTPDEMRSLLGAYAVDAVDPDEAAEIERFLATDADARLEVDQHRATLARFGDDDAVAPGGLWERIESRLDTRPALAPAAPPAPSEASTPAVPTADARVVPMPARTRNGPTWRATALIAAASALVAAIVSVGIVRMNTADPSSSDGIAAAAEEARNREGAQVVALRTDGGEGTTEAEVVYLPDGDAWFEARGLQPLPADQVYQLWALVGSPTDPEVISAGVLGREPGTWGFRFDGPVVGFVITIEDAPGVVSSAQPATLVGTLS